MFVKIFFLKTFLGSLVRTVFPSPDGAYLVQNQAATDPIGDLPIDKVAFVLKAVRRHQSLPDNERNTNDLKKVLLDIIGCKANFTVE